MNAWKFYGRRDQLATLAEMLGRKRWFFAKVTGRRRIGKTTLIQQALQFIASQQPVFYVQIPDSLYNRITDSINLTHLDPSSILAILPDRANDPQRSSLRTSITSRAMLVDSWTRCRNSGNGKWNLWESHRCWQPNKEKS